MSDPAELTSHLGFWLRQVSNHVSHAFALKVESCGVTVAEWVILRQLWRRGPVAPSRLAREIGITRGAVSKLAERLLAKALIRRTSGEGDLRTHTLALTPAGEALVPRLALLADQNDVEFFGHLGARDRAKLENYLRGIAERSGTRTMPVD